VLTQSAVLLCRLVLEASGEALAAVAQLHTVVPARTGVFVGISWTEYAHMASDAGTGGWGYATHSRCTACCQLARVKHASMCAQTTPDLHACHPSACPLTCSRERLHRPRRGAECVPWPGGLPLCPQGSRRGGGHCLLLLPGGNQLRWAALAVELCAVIKLNSPCLPSCSPVYHHLCLPPLPCQHPPLVQLVSRRWGPLREPRWLAAST
jgi:hypothetical protein